MRNTLKLFAFLKGIDLKSGFVRNTLEKASHVASPLFTLEM